MTTHSKFSWRILVSHRPTRRLFRLYRQLRKFRNSSKRNCRRNRKHGKLPLHQTAKEIIPRLFCRHTLRRRVLTEFYAKLGDRASFLIPPDAENRISNGSRERYDHQLLKFEKMKIADKRVKPLVSLIKKYHKGYDQEGFIES